MWSGTDGGSQLYVGVKAAAEVTMAEFWPGQPQCQLVCVCVSRSTWLLGLSGMILASGARGIGFNSRSSPIKFGKHLQGKSEVWRRAVADSPRFHQRQ